MIVTATPWTASDADVRFQKAVAISVAAGLLAALIISLIPLPAPDELTRKRPPRLAEILLPPPEPIAPPVVELPKIKPPEPVEKKPEPIPEKKPEKPEAIVAEAPQTVKQAKEKARVSGLLAFQDQLQAMREQVEDSSLQDTASLSRGAGQAAELERSVITSNGPVEKKASVNTAALSRDRST